MSGKSNMDFIDGKRIKLEDTHEKITNFGATCRNLSVDCFKYKCVKFFTKQFIDKSVQAYNIFTNTGKISKTIF